MRGTSNGPARELLAGGLLGIGPKTSTLLCGTTVIVAAFTLGATWLGAQVLFLPVGVWILGALTWAAHVLGTSASAWRNETSHIDGADSGIASDQDADLSENDDAPSRRWKEPADVGAGLARAAMELAGVPARHVQDARRQLERLTQRLRGGQAELRIGFDISEREFREILSVSGGESLALAGVCVRLLRAPAGLMGDANHDARGFDALVRKGADSHLCVYVHERDDAPAAWFDWSKAPPLGFASVFPSRLDCARVSLGPSNISSGGVARLVLWLSVTGGVLSRTPDRLGKQRLLGGPGTLPDAPLVLAAAMSNLAGAMLDVGPSHAGAREAAARVVSAYCARTGIDLPAGECADLARAASEILPGETEVTLRLAATQLNSGLIDHAKVSLVRGFRQLRADERIGEGDTLAMVMSEAEHSGHAHGSLGRVCAGVCLAWGGASSKSLDYLRDDLIDDLKHAGWPTGHERELSLLRDVVSVLERELLAGSAATARRAA